VENQLLSLSKIFTERIFRIPDYQRGYAWTNKQLKDFWNDLIQLDETKNHYTGVLTLEDVPEQTVNVWTDDQWIIRSKRYFPYYIVDGQQRLTTAIILIHCIIEHTPENQQLNYTTINEIRKKFIFDTKDEGISRSYLFGYEKDNPSYEFLKTRIFLEKSDNSFPMQETIYTHNLENAKSFFLDKLKDMPLEEIEVLYRKLTQNFLFNIYAISEDIDVYVAFETMNNRGKPLSHLELLKNRLIYLSTKFETDDFERQKLRHAINESWKSVYHYLGKNKNKPLDDDEFLNNHFITYHGYNILKDGREIYLPESYFYPEIFHYSSYQNYLLEEKFTPKNIFSKTLTVQEIYSYVQSLKESVETWYQILNPKDSSFSEEEKFWLEKLNKLDIRLFAPLLMIFYQKEKNAKIRLRLLKALERFLFYLTFPNYPYARERLNRRQIFDSSTQLSKGEIQPEKVIRDIEQVIEDLSANETYIESIINELHSTGFYGWRGIKYFLFEYELEFKSRTKTYRDKIDWDEFSREDDRDFYTVEHIYPQRPRRSCWTEIFKSYTERERSALRHSLGNLVPLSRPKNSSFQNKCFEEKKGNTETHIGFRYGSYSENEIASLNDWTAKEILERGLKLVNFMEKRWKLKFGDSSTKIRLLNLEFVPDKEHMVGSAV
jgi:hypothetical protein